MSNTATVEQVHTVISNDTTTAQAVETATAIENLNGAVSLQTIEQLRITWQEGAYRTSNLALYGVLARCMAYAGDLPTSDAKERNKALKAFFDQRGYRYMEDAPLITRVVRAVFGGDIDRRRLSTYSLVLRSAKQAKVLPSQLTDWIEQNGGIQEIKLARSSTFVSPKQKAETAKREFSALKDLGVVKTEALSQLADGDFVGNSCVLLAEQQADGSFAIRALLRNASVVNAAFTSLYAKQKDTDCAIAAPKATAAANDNTARQTA